MKLTVLCILFSIVSGFSIEIKISGPLKSYKLSQVHAEISTNTNLTNSSLIGVRFFAPTNFIFDFISSPDSPGTNALYLALTNHTADFSEAFLFNIGNGEFWMIKNGPVDIVKFQGSPGPVVFSRTINISNSVLQINGNVVLSNRQPAIASPTSSPAGILYTDTEKDMLNELFTSMTNLLSAMRKHGLIEP